jgi:hypothetical protein
MVHRASSIRESMMRAREGKWPCCMRVCVVSRKQISFFVRCTGTEMPSEDALRVPIVLHTDKFVRDTICP